jgi:MFS family permease
VNHPKPSGIPAPLDVGVEAMAEPQRVTIQTFRPLHAWLVILAMTITYILSNIDRQLISILIVPIQRDLRVTDTEFGALQGLAYGLFYAAFCIPIASLSDRYSRSLVISLGLALWSAATVACGFADTFEHLFAARAMVGIGEASLVPAVYSLIGDLFPREKLGRATGVFAVGPFVGSTLAFVLGGVAFHQLGEAGVYGLMGHTFRTWELTFLLAGAPGLALAVVILILVRDPRGARAPVETGVRPPSFARVLRFIGDRPGVFFPLLVGFPLLIVSLYAALGWAPAYLIRTDHYTSAQAGVWLGAVSLVAGAGGALLAGVLTDTLGSRRRAAPFEVGMLAAGILCVVMLLVSATQIQGVSIFVVASAIFFGSCSMAPSGAVIQLIAPSEFRSRISAIFIVANILAQTCGNFFIGFLNDHAFKGPHGIGLSLPIFMALTALGSVIILARGRKALAAAMMQSDVQSR